MDSKQRLRARAILVFVLISGGILVGALYWTQIVNGDKYSAKAEKQYAKPTATLFDRGSIYFLSKDGTRPAAAAVASGFLVFMNPTELAEPETVYEALSHYIDTDREEFMRKATKTGDVYEEIARKVDEETAASVRELKIKGIGTAKETWRTYPGGELAAHLLGVVGESGDGKIKGRYGLEQTHEPVLARSGAGGSNIFAELFSGIAESVFGETKEGDIMMTIEPTVQGFLEDIMEEVETDWNPDEIGAIVLNPHTGEIVAMGARPSFDPNDLSKVKDVKVLSNPLVEHVYEMGSIMKPLTMAIGLDSGVISPESTYDDTGTMTLSGKKISNVDGKARGVTSMQDVLSHSLNVGAATIALKAGKEIFAKYFDDLGITSKTGIDLPNEAASISKNLKTGRDIEIATASYGQGIAISPVSMARALSVLANGGYVVNPHVTKIVGYKDGTSKTANPNRMGPVLSKDTTDEVTRMLVKVVDTALKKGAIKMDHYSIAAKTGTAQIPDPSRGGYYEDKYLHSFFGYFPAYDPKFLVFIYQIDPKGANFASETLTDPFAEIAKFLISYYEIAPDR